MAVAEKVRPSGRVAFTYPNFMLFLVARWFIVLALEMQSVAVGWQVYDITKKPLDLGLVGLAQFTPSFLLFLVSGHVADRSTAASCFSFAIWVSLFAPACSCSLLCAPAHMFC